MENQPKKYSVIIPIYNEEESLLPLYYSLKSVMERLKAPYEMIFVDDGSTDRSFEKLKNIAASSASLTVISLNGRCGKSAALQTGFDAAQGEILITLDGDLQNDPEDIPKLLEKMNQGYEIVCGWRVDRKDPFHKKIASKIANRVRTALLQEKIHDVGCGLRVFKKTVLKKIRLWGNQHRFFTALVLRQGFRIGEEKVNHRFRQFGKSKYGIWDRLVEGIADLIRFQFRCPSKPPQRGFDHKIKEIIKNESH